MTFLISDVSLNRLHIIGNCINLLYLRQNCTDSIVWNTISIDEWGLETGEILLVDSSYTKHKTH